MTEDPRLVRLQVLAKSQAGVFRRKQALACGFSPAEIDTEVRQERWLRCGYGAMAIAADSDPDTAHARTCAARILRVGGDIVVSHASAGVLMRLPYVDVPAAPTLTRVRSGPVQHRNGLFVSEVPAAHRAKAYGLTLTTGARTLVDLLRNAPDELHAQALADGGLRTGLEPAALDAVLLACARWPGVEQARRALAFAEPKCESPLESRCRIWFRDGGLELPTPQYLVRAPGVYARVDFCFEEHRLVVEADGQLKFTDPSRARPQETLWQEKLREDDLRALGFEVVRAYWKDGKDHGADLCRRLRAKMAPSASTYRTTS